MRRVTVHSVTPPKMPRKAGIPPWRREQGVTHGKYPCPKCGWGTMVTDSRPTQGTIRRARCCANGNCGHRFSTYETPALPGSVEPGLEMQTIIHDLEALAARYRATLGRMRRN